METPKPITPIRGRAALLATACMLLPLSAGEPRGGSGTADSETSRRSVAVQEARELLRKGDESYTTGKYAEAVEAYAGARDLIPIAPVSAELRAAATERYAQASVELARELSKKGDIAAAKAAVDKILDPAVAPENPGALVFRAQLDDPIRTNPALTAEHAANVDEVRRLIYTAQGAFDLGKFDQAEEEYERVLRIDPTNAAARRGMERVASAKAGYYESAYDASRAEMLSQVDAAWELQVPPEVPVLGDADDLGVVQTNAVRLRDKLDRIIIPQVALDQVSLDEALDFLRLRASENDTTELDPALKGVNFAVNLGAPDSEAAQAIRAIRFDLRLSNIPLSQVLEYVTEITRTSYTTDDFAVVISPLGSLSEELVARTYRVPPDFISSMNAGAPAAEEANPFGEAPQEGLLAARLGAKEALEAQGVGFPEGSSATYTPAGNILRVVNTQVNQDYIAQVIDTLTQTEPVLVAVKVTMIRVQQSTLAELGFDWLLDNYGFGGDSWVTGADELNLSGGTQGNGGDLSDIPLPAGATVRNPITAGNRSGDSAISGNNIDALLGTSAGRQSDARAPGILGIRGNLNDASVQMLMRGLDQKTGVDLMARPSVVTRSGQSSNVAVIREFIYPTEYEPPELPNSTGNDFGGGGTSPVTPATPTAFDTRDVGITLEVLPVAAANKSTVNVTLNPVFTDFDGFVNYGSPINTTAQGLLGPETVQLTENAILMPVFSRQTVNSSIDVADGGTVVVGGLLQETVQNVEDETPILGKIPVLGRFFQSKARKSTSTAIFFLVNVELMDPTGRPYRNR